MTAAHTEPDTPQEAAAEAPARALPGKPFARPLAIGLAFLIVIGIVYGAVRYVTYGRFIEKTNDAYLKADIVDIAPKLPGYVEAVLVGDNEQVSAGTPLVRMSVVDSGAQLSQLSAELAAAQATVAQTGVGLLRQDAEIAVARAEEREAQSALAHARAEVDRYTPLVKAGAEPREKLDRLRQAYDAAEAGFGGATARAQAATRQREALDAELNGVRARMSAIIAQQRRAQNDVALSTLKSSIDGRIGDRTVRVGQYVQIGQRLMSVVPVKHIYLVANFKETQVRRMRRGQPARIAVDALDGEMLEGVVESFSPGTGSEFALLPPQNATGNFTKVVQRVPVKIRLTGPLPADRIIIPGMSVVVSVDTRTTNP